MKVNITFPEIDVVKHWIAKKIYLAFRKYVVFDYRENFLTFGYTFTVKIFGIEVSKIEITRHKFLEQMCY